MRQNLPESFQIQMQALLGDEYGAYLESFDVPPGAGLRVNTAKWSPAEAAGRLNVPLRPVPWTDNGFYCDGQGRLAKNPYYYAGLYYLQEPSAMAPARFLPVKPGDRVLDLCAAPGGKSTELGARLRGEGLLWANDISNSRAKALLKNLERFGIANLCVSSETPERLAERYPGFFDSVLVDAPCSGEGMFRRDPDMVKDWEKRGPEYYAPLQREILRQAATLLRPGGYLMYSTCTFSELEDEGNVRWLLECVPEVEIVPLEVFSGAVGGKGLTGCLRLFPHKVEGEGHFLALMRKKPADAGGCGRAADAGEHGWAAETKEAADGERGTMTAYGAADDGKPGGAPKKVWRADGGKSGQTAKESVRAVSRAGGPADEAVPFLDKCRMDWDAKRFLLNGDTLYYLPENFVPAPGLRYLRTGLCIGTVRKGRFEPSQAMAMVLDRDTFADCISFAHGDERLVRYLKGETVFLNENEAERQGWQLLCVDGFGLGFVKASGRTLKNQYSPGWRWM